MSNKQPMGSDAQLTFGRLSRGFSWWEFIRGRNDRIPVQHYKSLRVAVMICATLVNTQTLRQTAFDRVCY